jgi:hypothetical protein
MEKIVYEQLDRIEQKLDFLIQKSFPELFKEDVEKVE